MGNNDDTVLNSSHISPEEKLIRVQMDALVRIRKEMTNFKKLNQDQRTKRLLRRRLKRCETLRAEFVNRHQKIVQLSDDNSDEYFIEDIFDAFDNEYLEVTAAIETMCDDLFPDEDANESNIQANSTSNDTAAAPSMPQRHVIYNITNETPFKLPELSIPHFDGDYTEWPAFYDAFLQVHNHPKLTTNQKFSYLKSALSSRVKSLIGWLDITADNYDEALNELKRRYDNKRVLFHSHMDKFMNQPSIVHETSDEFQTLHDVSRSCQMSIRKLGAYNDQCGSFLAFILIKKLPQQARLDWEKELGKSTEIPTFDQFLDFLDTRFRTMEAVYPQNAKKHAPKSSSHSHSSKTVNRKEFKSSFHVASKGSNPCPMCSQSHALRKCSSFLQLGPFERKSFVDKSKLCTNCLGHSTDLSCSSSRSCFTCGAKHHTLLHFGKSTPANNTFNPNKPSTSFSSNACVSSPIGNMNVHSNNIVNANSKIVLLTTALVDVPDINGQLIRLRALVDQGSQHSIITSRAAQRLKLPITPICVGIRPMGDSQFKTVNKGLSLTLFSIIDKNYSTRTTAAILPSISSELPLFPVKISNWSHIQSLPLADPHYASPGQIDLLLAGDVFSNIIQSGLCKGQIGEPVAQNTTLGWILSGELYHQNHVAVMPVSCNYVSTVEIENCIKKFQELEEVPTVRKITKEDEWTEEFYEKTTQRQANGKFMVRLPLKSYFDSTAVLGSSYQNALKRFHSLQRKFARDEEFRKAYFDVFNEYKTLNQVKLVTEINEKHFYLPHHAVLKADSLTTKLRQVFDASSKSSNGNSLNDILTTGPSLQNDLVTIILNWRVHQYVFISDITKMYRCIDIHPDDSHYQLVLWQNDPNECIQTYALTTVTFGVSPSPYLAIKSLHCLAESERHSYPLAHDAIKDETYVDDVTTGHDTIDGAIELMSQLIHMLRSGGFELRKWASNSNEILQHIPTAYREQNTTCLFNSDESIKALGLGWSTTKDSFSFNVTFPISEVFTKRTVSSTIGRLFDPLGWLNPLVTKAKMFLNKLWQEKLDWDVNLSDELKVEWREIIDQLKFINQIEVPRWLHTTSQTKHNELHVFCDSSQKAYAAAIYLRTIDSGNDIHVNLLTAKSKLTPIRNPLIIHRAELSGAVLAVKLLHSVSKTFRLKSDKVFLWTDSQVVLSWIRGNPNRWSTFIFNRVHHILSFTEIEQWHYIESKQNPADHNSRGLTVTQLRDTTIWWKGPHFLSLPQSQWPVSKFDLVADDEKELRSSFKTVNMITNEPSRIDTIMHRFSNFNRLRRAIAYAIRFVHNVRNSIKNKSLRSSSSQLNSSINKSIGKIPSLTVAEIQHSENSIIRWIQSNEFSSELRSIHHKKDVDKSSKLFRLNPFIDENGLLRVNGRLRNAFMSFNEKFPLIIPQKSRISYLILDFYHRLTLHGGPQVTVNQIRQNFWILNARTLARNFIHKCVICFKHNPQFSKQLMGDLPLPRVNDLTRPFAATIIDYAGPYDIRASKGRGQSSYKGYVAIFTCMATKAVHLEAVGDLTSQTFLYALDRFISRRGYCHDIYSDNGTNFLGASNENQRTQLEFEQSIEADIVPYLSNRNIQWHFSPPSSPHFNGLVEASVKSMKFHFKRVIQNAKLTYEEFATVLIRIEAVLNSRPISPITANANDFTALTPGHFLIGAALLARPQPVVEINPTKRHQMMEQMVQHFWNRFRQDMLSSLQIRTKWNETQPNLKENDLVIIKDDRFPVGYWPMGRIVAVHTGKDNLVRAATVRTSGGTFKRPIVKLALVPIHDNIEN